MKSFLSSATLAAALAGAVLIAGSPAGGASANCPTNLAESLAWTGSASQVITVEATSASSTVASLRLWRRSRSCWLAAAGPWQARLGLNGLSDHHREGDGTTPTGAYALGPVVYGIASSPRIRYRYHRLVCGDWWDEDVTSPTYNTFQHLRCGVSPPFGGASEALWTDTVAYQHFLVVDYNAHPVVPGRGSAIFVHDDLGRPTNGCISLPAARLDALLRWLRPTEEPLIVIGTSREIRRS
jgi:L,D-peptidoglycan transpeptidase YkuD (ErfK/YbiS/YcfS/YnhG family)